MTQSPWRADRYFEIHVDLRKTVEQGIADNILAMALREKPRGSFYMVGRMEGQSVVLRAEKGKLRLMVDDEEGGGKQEVVHDVTAKDEERGRREETDGKAREAGDSGQETEGAVVYGGGEVPGAAVTMDGESQTHKNLPGTGDQLASPGAVARPGDGGDAPGAGARGSGKRSSIEPPTCNIVREKEEDADYSSGYDVPFKIILWIITL
jgi:hypothetical protein